MFKKAEYQIFLTSLIGNVTEYCSFTLFAMLINPMGKSFFPNSDSLTQVTLVFLVFGTGFISRPIGAIFFGHFGDKNGRRQSLIYTILGMSLVTFIISILPEYSAIGVAAPIILTLLRLLQGFFVGGEGPGSALFILEHNTNGHKGFIGGVIVASVVFGSFLAILISLLVEKCDMKSSLSWRIPFFVSSLIGLITLYTRYSLPETKDFIKIKRQSQILAIPIIQVLRYNWQRMILIAFLGGMTTAISYIIMAYLKTYLETQRNVHHLQALQYTSFSIFIFMVSLILLGIIANQYKPRSFIMFFAYLLTFFIIPIFIMLNSSNQFILILGLAIMPILAGGLCAHTYPYAMEQFSTEIRYTGVGLSYTLGIAVFGGFTPVICSYFIRITNLCYSPAFYIIFLGFLYLLCENNINKPCI